jgi:uncharacterized protein
MTANSALYLGSVVHRRLRPKRHYLRYAAFWMLLDLDEIGDLDRRLILFSRGRFNAMSFFDTDHGEQTREPLRRQVERHLTAAGIAADGGAIRLLCMPRIFGYGFNPLSIYFCYRRDGALAALLYEVRNTFGERHSYLIAVEQTGGGAGGAIRQSCDKCFYVSPFMDMRMRYQFRVVPPERDVSVAISAGDAQGPTIVASLAGRREALTDAALLRLLLRVPFLTLKVMAAIHWHALRMWLKGFALKPRPAKPAWPVTTVRAGERTP